MTDGRLRVAYHLAETVIAVSGTKTTQVSLETGERVTVGDAATEISAEVQADPHDWMRVVPPESWLSDSKLTIELSDDGRLVSVGSSSTGRAGQAVKGVISLVTTAVGAAAGAMTGGRVRVFAEEGAEDGERSWGGKPEGVGPERRESTHVYPQADRIAAIDRRLTALQDKQLAFLDELVSASDAQQRYAASSAARLMSRAIEDLRAELSLVLAHKQAWTEATRNRQVESFDYSVRVTELVKNDEIEDWPDAALPGHVAAMEMVRDLNVLVTRRREQVHGDATRPPSDGSIENGVWFRHPRQVELTVYSVDLEGDSQGPKKYLTEVDRQVIHVVDDDCRHEFIPFDKDMWGKSSADATFNDVGGLSTLSSDRASGAAAAAAAFGELPETVKSALTTASGILETAAKIEDRSINRAITRLENEKKLLEADIAAGTTASTEFEQRRIAELNARRDLLVARKDLGNKAIDLEVQRLGAGTDVAGRLATLEKTALEAWRDAEAAAQETAANSIKAELSLKKEIAELRRDAITARADAVEAMQKLAARLEGSESFEERLDALTTAVEALSAQR